MHDKPRWLNVVVLVALLALTAASVGVALLMLNPRDRHAAPRYEASEPVVAPDAFEPVDETELPDADTDAATPLPLPSRDGDATGLPHAVPDGGLDRLDDGPPIPAVERPDTGLDALAEPSAKGLPAAEDADGGLPSVETDGARLPPANETDGGVPRLDTDGAGLGASHDSTGGLPPLDTDTDGSGLEPVDDEGLSASPSS